MSDLKLDWRGLNHHPYAHLGGFEIVVYADYTWKIFEGDSRIASGKTTKGVHQAQLNAEKWLLNYLKGLVAKLEGGE